MTRGKTPVLLSGLSYARARWSTLHPQSGELPGSFVLDFRQAGGPAILGDGRALIATLTPAELADVLGSIPALSLTRDDGDLRALLRVTDLLRGEAP